VRSTVAVGSVTQVGLYTTLSLDGSLLTIGRRSCSKAATSPTAPRSRHGHRRSRPIAVGHRGTSASANACAKATRTGPRTAQYIQGIQPPTRTPDRRDGDFNAFEFSDVTWTSSGIISGDLTRTARSSRARRPGDARPGQPREGPAGAERYSYVFGGSAQTLDHTLTTANLAVS